MAFDSPCEVVGVVEAPEGKPSPFILVRIKCAERKETFLLKCEEGISWYVMYVVIFLKIIYLFQKFAAQF